MKRIALIVAAGALCLSALSQNQLPPTATVGLQKDGRTILPVNQVMTPAGRQVELPGVRPQAIALSPNGKILVTAGKSAELIVIDPASAEVRQRVLLPPEPPNEKNPAPSSQNILEPDDKGQLGFTGLVFSPDGRTNLSQQRQRQHQGLLRRRGQYGRAGQIVRPSAGLRPAPRRGDPGRDRRLPGREAALHRLEPVQPPRRIRRRRRPPPPVVRDRRPPVRRRPRRRAGLRLELGRAAARSGRPHRPRGPGNTGQGGPEDACRQPRLDLGHRPRERADPSRDPRRAAFLRPRPLPRQAAIWSAPTPRATT